VAKTRASQRPNSTGKRRDAAAKLRPLALIAAAVGVAAVATVGAGVALGGAGGERAVSQTSPLPAPGVVRLDERGQADGRPLPDADLELFDGGTATFADFRGKPLVINFFASWCTSCLAELPRFQAVYAANREHVQFLGVNLQDSRAAGEELIHRAGLTYPIAMDRRGELFTMLRAYAMPTTVFVHPDGTVAELHGGELDAEQLTERLRRHDMIPREAASR
jgi:peroxiredoxin